MKFYASLTGPLLGLYFPLDFETENECRIAMNTSKLKSLWCAIYTKEQAEYQAKEYGGIVLPDKYGYDLDYDSLEVASCK